MRFLLTLAAMALPVCAQGWYNPLWRYRKAIEIDRSTVACDTGTTQANFPALIALTNDPDLAAHARWDNSDILFTAGDGTTKLDREVESFTWNSGTLLAWVRIPALACAAATTDTTIYIYYGSPAGTELNAATVWDSHYLAVLHFANAQTPGKDSTGNHNDGAAYAVTSGAGMTGNGGVFDGLSSHITGGGARIQGGEFTLQAWIHPLWASGTVVDIGTDTGVDHLLHFYQRSDTGIWLDYTWDIGGIEQDSTVLTGAWNFVASRLSSAKALTVTKNLASWGPFNVTGLFAGTSTYTIGRAGEDAHNFFPGTIDELRISNVRRSDAWLKTEYQNQSNPGGFLKSIGSEEANGTILASPKTMMMIPVVIQ